MTTPLSTKGGVLAHIDTQIAAIQKPGLLPKGFTISVAKMNYNGPGLATMLTDEIEPLSALAAAKAALKTAEAAAKAAEAAIKLLSEEVDAGIKAYFGFDDPILASFDIKVRTPRAPRTTAQNLQQALKAAETRKQRGTLAPKRKAAIKATSVPPTTLVVDDDGVHSVAATSSTPSTAGTVVPTTVPATSSAPATSGSAAPVAAPAATGSTSSTVGTPAPVVGVPASGSPGTAAS
jgi:hypothetical protein